MTVALNIPEFLCNIMFSTPANLKERDTKMGLQKFLLTLERNSEGMYKVYDRFTFDDLFRLLLSRDFEHEEALNFILCNCSLRAIIFEERIYNKYYLSISAGDITSPDFATLRNQYLFEIVQNEVLAVIEEIRKEIERLEKE